MFRLFKCPSPITKSPFLSINRATITTEVYDFRKKPNLKQAQPKEKIVRVNSLLLHPVFHPNKGPIKELYFAEEGIGLLKSLDWNVVKGPFWNDKSKHNKEKDIDYEKDSDDKISEEENNENTKGGGRVHKRKEKVVQKTLSDFVDVSNLKDGDYVYSSLYKGTYYQGGVIMDLSTTEDEEDELYHEWKNKLLRTSIAKSSMLKVKFIKSNTFLGKGKIIEIGEYIKAKQINAVFINSELTPIQIRNLEKSWSMIANDEQEGIGHMRISNNFNAMSDIESDNESSRLVDNNRNIDNDTEKKKKKKVKVFDRFTIILQIFALRAKTRIARLQIELAFLKFLKTKLVRDGYAFTGMYNIFGGDLMSAQEIKLEVISAKQKRGSGPGVTTGEGESQLEIERRIVNDKEAKIKREILNETNQRQRYRQKKQTSLKTVPSIALVGYTNAGKSALMNKLTKANVESEDKLFQTLTTTSKKLNLKSGQLGILMDTIGFISNLPHDLVESFKCTLEEVQDADIVLHIRDISHPNTEDQKSTVMEVLRELDFNENFYTTRMIEVWNKIDLLTIPLNLDEIKNSPYPIIPISALHGTNCDKLIEVITTKSNELMGKKLYTVISPIEKHSERLNWLIKFANIPTIENFEYDYTKTKEYPYGNVKYEINLDESTYRRFVATFGELAKTPKNKVEIPEDWLKNSKSFFERRLEKEQLEKSRLEQIKKEGKDEN